MRRINKKKHENHYQCQILYENEFEGKKMDKKNLSNLIYLKWQKEKKNIFEIQSRTTFLSLYMPTLIMNAMCNIKR